MVDNIGRTVAYSYDSDRRLTGVTDVAGDRGAWHTPEAGDCRRSPIREARWSLRRHGRLFLKPRPELR